MLRGLFPIKLKSTADFIKVDSLADLDEDDPDRDGKKYYFDEKTRYNVFIYRHD